MSSKEEKIRNIFPSIQVHKELAKGAYGVVFSGLNIETQQEVAVKYVDLQKIVNEDERAQITQEIYISQEIRNQPRPNVIQILACEQTPDDLFIVMELCQISLDELIAKLIFKGLLDEVFALNIFFQMLNGLTFLHGLKYIHRDVKPQNFMFKCDQKLWDKYKTSMRDEDLQAIRKNGQIKLIDFGISKFYDQEKDDLVISQCGSPQYMAPEVTQGLPYDFKADLYSLGMILQEMLMPKQFSLKLRIEDLDLGQLTKQLLDGLLQQDPSKRLSSDQIYQLREDFKQPHVPITPLPSVNVKRSHKPIKFLDDDEANKITPEPVQQVPVSVSQKEDQNFDRQQIQQTLRDEQNSSGDPHDKNMAQKQINKYHRRNPSGIKLVQEPEININHEIPNEQTELFPQIDTNRVQNTLSNDSSNQSNLDPSSNEESVLIKRSTQSSDFSPQNHQHIIVIDDKPPKKQRQKWLTFENPLLYVAVIEFIIIIVQQILI